MQKEYLDRFIKIYSIIFISAFFSVLLLQLAIPNVQLNSISKQFLWRNNLIGKFNNFRFMMGDSVFYQAMVGKEGWLYYTGEKSIQDYQKALLLKPKDIKRATNSLSVLQRQVVKNGGKLIVVIAPDKNTIYPQYIPEQITILGQATRMDQLIKFIKEKKVDIEIIDLRPILMEASLSKQVYYKTDTHWNCFGAYSAYEKVMSEVAASVDPKLRPHPLSDFDIFSEGAIVMGVPKTMMLDIQENRLQAIPKFQQKPFHNGKDLPTALVFGDSFYRWCFDRFFESNFSRTIFTSWKNILKNEGLIDKEQPDVVIVEFSERYMGDLLTRLTRR